MVFVSLSEQNAADNHQVRISPVLCIILMWYLIIGVAFLILLCLYTNEYPVFIWILFALHACCKISYCSLHFITLKITYDETGFITKILSAGVKDMEYTDVRSFSIGRIYTFICKTEKR